MAWHNDGWDGHICKDPKSNTYCCGRFSYPGDIIAQDRKSKYDISQADMYQLLSYAKIYQAQEKKEVKLYLIYPKTETFNETKILFFKDNLMDNGTGTEIKIVPFDIEKSLDYKKYKYMPDLNDDVR